MAGPCEEWQRTSARLPVTLRRGHPDAIYAFQFSGSKLIKVGRSGCIYDRLGALVRERRQEGRLLFVLLGQGHLERRLLAELEPFTVKPRNGRSGPVETFRPVPEVIRILDRWHRQFTAAA